jgi:hypothetical protein
MQRKIRVEFWDESGENIKILNKLIDDELKNSELYSTLMKHKAKVKELTTV